MQYASTEAERDAHKLTVTTALMESACVDTLFVMSNPTHYQCSDNWVVKEVAPDIGKAEAMARVRVSHGRLKTSPQCGHLLFHGPAHLILEGQRSNTSLPKACSSADAGVVYSFWWRRVPCKFSPHSLWQVPRMLISYELMSNFTSVACNMPSMIQSSHVPAAKYDWSGKCKLNMTV